MDLVHREDREGGLLEEAAENVEVLLLGHPGHVYQSEEESVYSSLATKILKMVCVID